MKNLLVILFIPVMFFLSCKKDNTSDKIRVDYDILVNQTFELYLISHSSDGGYRWSWVNKQSISTVDSIGFNYVVDSDLVGAGGTEIWTFKGTKSGIDSIKFEYKQPWSSNSTIDKKYIIVRVK